MTDAEGAYIYDLVDIGGFANTGADLSLYATEILKDYMFMIPDEDDIEKCIVGKGGKVKVIRRQEGKRAC